MPDSEHFIESNCATWSTVKIRKVLWDRGLGAREDCQHWRSTFEAGVHLGLTPPAAPIGLPAHGFCTWGTHKNHRARFCFSHLGLGAKARPTTCSFGRRSAHIDSEVAVPGLTLAHRRNHDEPAIASPKRGDFGDRGGQNGIPSPKQAVFGDGIGSKCQEMPGRGRA